MFLLYPSSLTLGHLTALFATVRALDSGIGLLWSQYRGVRPATGPREAIEKFVSAHVDVPLFCTGAGAVMWAWFYFPDALPRAYREWIRRAAQVDNRLIQVLRQAREGVFVYGEEPKGETPLRSMCEDYGFPLVWSNPAKTIPVPCELLHMGTGLSCHWHALKRWITAFRFALATNLPLQLLLQSRHISWQTVFKAFKTALRSSAFLASFISLFYYGVCLARTQLGLKLLGPGVVSPMTWDQGLCIRAGCLLCGWSILIETKRKRQEAALFVAPRAAATILPRRYDCKVRIAFYYRIPG